MRYALVGLCLALSGVAYAAQPMETREIVLQCSGLTVRVNPMTSVAHVSYNMGYEYFRTRGAVDPHFIVIEPTLWGKVRIDREAMTYANEQKGSGSCKLMQWSRPYHDIHELVARTCTIERTLRPLKPAAY